MIAAFQLRQLLAGRLAVGAQGRVDQGVGQPSAVAAQLLDPREELVAAGRRQVGRLRPGASAIEAVDQAARPHRPASIESSADTAAPRATFCAPRDHLQLREREDIIIRPLPEPVGRDPDEPRQSPAGADDERLVLGVRRRAAPHLRRRWPGPARSPGRRRPRRGTARGTRSRVCRGSPPAGPGPAGSPRSAPCGPGRPGPTP